MKKWLILISTLFVACSIYAQDKIITIKGDTIDGKIISTTKQNITFEHKINNLNTVSTVEKKQIKEYIFGETKELPQFDNTEIDNEVDKINKHRNKWRVTTNLDVAYRLANTSDIRDQLKQIGFESSKVGDYIRELRFGYGFSGDIHYLLMKSLGLGISYQFYNAQSNLSGTIDLQDEKHYFVTEVSDNIFTNFIGLSLSTQANFNNNSKLKYYAQLSVGGIWYRDQAISYLEPVLITGSSVASISKLGVEYSLNKGTSFNIGLKFMAASLSEITIEKSNGKEDIELDSDNYENISRLGLSAGLSFYF